MTAKKLNIAFVWHMHQPPYKDALTGEYVLPWALLHATKDYLDMASILEEFPDIRQTFNLVPSLMEQLMDYAGGRARDVFNSVASKPVSELTRDEKTFILRNFFHANRETMIRPAARYWELFRKRGEREEDAVHALRYFRGEDYLDLEVLFNLAWVDPVIRQRDPFLGGLVKKERGYTEEEKKGLLAKQVEITGRVLPKYRELQEKGVIEVSTSPYYHPILPLLYDSFSARVAMPHAKLPEERFAYPEDARAQVRSGAALYTEVFGRPPRGMWPPEGSVSAEILPLFTEEGVSWIASDEEILAQTVKRHIKRDARGNPADTFLYRPYHFDVGGRRLHIFFRDHVLSDLIGFDYAKMDPERAAEDFIERLLHIRGRLDDPEKHVVPVILDGENAWETYRNDGRDFLVALYSRLSGNQRLRCVTLSDFLATKAPSEELKWLFPGSWINHNFKVWIGHPEDNTAWDYIHAARKALVSYQGSMRREELEARKAALEEAWDEVFRAEASDWFWWYGEEHSSAGDAVFDSLFRGHLKKVYLLIGAEPPPYLDIPILLEERGVLPLSEPTAYIYPSIDGEITNYFEWLAAGRIHYMHHGTAMHREAADGGLIEGISYGFSPDTLFMRFDYPRPRVPYEGEWSFKITVIHPGDLRVEGGVAGRSSKALVYEKPAGEWREAGPLERISSGRVVELGIPLKALSPKRGGEIRFFINIDSGEFGTQRWPSRGYISIRVPTEEFEKENWMV